MRLLDIHDDEEWFSFKALNDWEYTLETTNLAGEEDTVLELYGHDSTTQLREDDNSGVDGGSRII